jgi:hypothetical protein
MLKNTIQSNRMRINEKNFESSNKGGFETKGVAFDPIYIASYIYAHRALDMSVKSQ